MKTSFKLFTFLGSPVEVSAWFFLLLVFFSIPQFIAIFISVLIHEMAHVYTTDRLGWSSWGINIDLLFGTAQVQKNIPPKDNILIVLAGPVSNLILSVVCSIISFLGIFLGISFFEAFFDYMIIINLLMFFFNIFPIYPLDGGRVVRDVTEVISNSKSFAIKISAISSLVLSAILLIVSLKFGLLVMSFFSLLFIYVAVSDLKMLRKSV